MKNSASTPHHPETVLFEGRVDPQCGHPFFAESLRPEVPPPEGARALDQIPLLTPTAQEVEAGIPEVKELWRDTFGI